MADGFVCDTGAARQVSERLTSVGTGIESFPKGPQPKGPLGAGILDAAWSEFEAAIATARQGLVQSVNETSKSFAALARGATNLDQQEAGAI
jgi:hypothetical protein